MVLVPYWAVQPVPLGANPVARLVKMTHDEVEEGVIVESKEFVEVVPVATHQLVHDVREPLGYHTVVAATVLYVESVKLGPVSDGSTPVQHPIDSTDLGIGSLGVSVSAGTVMRSVGQAERGGS